MGAKKIQISPDAGTTWYTFPGDKGEFHNDATAINDTVLGQTYKSSQTGMLQWTVQTNGYYKGFAGYVATVKKSGTPTAFTGEAMTLVSGKTYKIGNAVKNVWNRLVTPTFTDNAVAVIPADILSIDYLFGTVTFTSGHTVTGPILATGSYLPTTAIASANGFTLTQTADTVNKTDFTTAQSNGGYMVYDYGLRTVSLALKGFYNVSNGFLAAVQGRAEVVVEISPDGAGNAVARGFMKPMTSDQAGNVGELETQDVTYQLAVPDQQDVISPFTWSFASSSTLNNALKQSLLAWSSQVTTNVNYLEDGATGHKGTAVVTEATLTGGLDVMNEFALKFQGSGAPLAFP
jgi:hypothetical protein